MIPVLAIVGRPNVGKSTLFNCLTRSRDALVSDMPGMTRDRQYGEANYQGFRFIAIDTGGITNEPGDLDVLTTQQSLQAIDEADKVLFVVDGRAGLSNTDLLVAEKLRGMNKKNVYLAVNKTEGLEDELAVAEFYRLGFGEPFAIAASHGAGVTDLINTIFKEEQESAETETEEDDGRIKLAIIGRPNVGKSTLTNRMLGEERVIVYDQPGTTRDSIFVPLERLNKQYTLIDTAGIRRRGKIFEATEKFSVVKTLQAIEATNVVVFVMDAREGVTDQDLRLLGFILESGKALVLAINKWDGMKISDKDKTRDSIDRRLTFVPFVRVHYISALHGTGVGNLFASVNEAYESARKKVATTKLTKILQEAVVQHAPPMVHGRRIKLRYAHMGGHNPPLFVVHGNQVDSVPDDYRRYLANTFQTRLKLKGTPVRVDFKASENPFRERRNVLTESQKRKRTRVIQHRKRK